MRVRRATAPGNDYPAGGIAAGFIAMLGLKARDASAGCLRRMQRPWRSYVGVEYADF